MAFVAAAMAFMSSMVAGVSTVVMVMVAVVLRGGHAWNIRVVRRVIPTIRDIDCCRHLLVSR